MITVTAEEWTLFEESLERARAYMELEMKDDAIEELRQIPETLQGTLPFLMDALEVCIHFEHWDNVLTLALDLLEYGSEGDSVRIYAEACLTRAVTEGVNLERFADGIKPSSEYDSASEYTSDGYDDDEDDDEENSGDDYGRDRY